MFQITLSLRLLTVLGHISHPYVKSWSVLWVKENCVYTDIQIN